MSRPALEAFAGATPVIAVKASGVEDLVDNGVNGFLTIEDTEAYSWQVAAFLKELGWYDRERASYIDQPEEAVAIKAISYYNIAYRNYAFTSGRRRVPARRIRWKGVRKFFREILAV